jgi:hypothetical protein
MHATFSNRSHRNFAVGPPSPFFFAYVGAEFPDGGHSHSPLQGQSSAVTSTDQRNTLS